MDEQAKLKEKNLRRKRTVAYIGIAAVALNLITVNGQPIEAFAFAFDPKNWQRWRRWSF